MHHGRALRRCSIHAVCRLVCTVLFTAVPSYEIDYCVLTHIKLLVCKCSGVFDSEFKQFFCQYNEPTCVKYVKLDILPHVTNKQNMMQVISELSEYVSDVDAEMARRGSSPHPRTRRRAASSHLPGRGDKRASHMILSQRSMPLG